MCISGFMLMVLGMLRDLHQAFLSLRFVIDYSSKAEEDPFLALKHTSNDLNLFYHGLRSWRGFADIYR